MIWRLRSTSIRFCSERSMKLRSSASTIIWASGRCTTWFFSASRTPSGIVLEPQLLESVQITMAEDFGVQGRGAFYDQTGTIRDVVQNHLFQVLAIWPWKPRCEPDSESIRDEKVKVLKAIPALDEKTSFAGSFAAIAMRTAWRRIRKWRPLQRFDWRSIPGDGKEFRSTSGQVNACPLRVRKSSAGCENLPR